MYNIAGNALYPGNTWQPLRSRRSPLRAGFRRMDLESGWKQGVPIPDGVDTVHPYGNEQYLRGDVHCIRPEVPATENKRSIHQTERRDNYPHAGKRIRGSTSLLRCGCRILQPFERDGCGPYRTGAWCYHLFGLHHTDKGWLPRQPAGYFPGTVENIASRRVPSQSNTPK